MMNCHQIVDEEESLVRGVVRKRAGADDSGNPEQASVVEASQPPMTLTSPKILDMHDGSSYDAPAMITPVKEAQSCCILTSSSEDEVDENQILRQQLDGDAARREEESQSARSSSSDAATQLKLAQGLRTLKRIVECDYLSKDSNEGTSNTDHNTLESLHALSDSLSPELGSAMSGLLNAVHMIRDRSKLVNQETEDLVQDLHQSQQEASVQRKRARQTEQVARKLYKQNISLKEDVARLRKERRVLVDEVKSLRNQADEMKKLDNWRVLDQHMREAMMNHERIMFSARLKKRAESESSFSDNGKSGGVTSVSSFDSIDSLQFNSGSSSEDVLSVSEGECSQPEHKKDSRTDEYPDGVVTPSTAKTDAKAVEEETSTTTCEKDQPATENQSESKQENTTVTASTPQKARLFPGFGGLALGFKALAAEAERASRGIHEKAPQEKVIRKPVSESESKKGEKELLDNKPSETDMFGPVAISEANTTYNPVQISGHFGCKPRQKTAYPETLNSPETCDTTVGSTQGSSRLGASAVTGCTSSSGEDLEKVLMPLSVTFSSRSANENEESSQLGTPSVSPAGTPPGVQVPPLQPICDPQILRSLSIPSSSSREDDYVCFSQEAGAGQVGAGLYEC